MLPCVAGGVYAVSWSPQCTLSDGLELDSSKEEVIEGEPAQNKRISHPHGSVSCMSPHDTVCRLQSSGKKSSAVAPWRVLTDLGSAHCAVGPQRLGCCHCTCKTSTAEVGLSSRSRVGRIASCGCVGNGVWLHRGKCRVLALALYVVCREKHVRE